MTSIALPPLPAPPAGAVPTELPCALCGGRTATVVGTRGRDGNALRSVACTGCGLVWSDPRPHDTRQFYEEDYRRAYKDTVEPKPKHVLRAGRVALDRLSRIADLLRPGLRVLDVGSGGGEFSYLLASRGHRVTGVEPNIGYAEYARREYGLDVLRGFIGEVPLEPASRDLVTIWHVLEHTEDPPAVLRRLREVLVPGGLLVVEVPNIEATCQSPRSTFHDAHLVHFNVQTLGAMAAHCGLRTVRHGLSADGGNLTMVFTPEGAPQAGLAAPLPGNHARVAGVLAGHRPLTHLLRPQTLARTLRRLGGALEERRALAAHGGRTGRALLDRLYAQAPAPAAVPAWRFAAAALVALAFGWWLECELVDDAASFGMTTVQGTAAYLGVQLAVLAGLALLTRLLGASRGRMGGLAVLLAAMPVLH